MRLGTSILLAAAVVQAQRAKDEPICDYYVKALLKDNTAENQAALLTLLVNTVVIGNYTTPNVGVQVPGILAPGEADGQKVNLAPYFTGALASTNRGGAAGVSVNFLDGGGAAPLKKNKPADDTSSRQYFLLTHLYQFFGSLLGCTKQGMAGFDAYGGGASMYKVHKFMNLTKPQVDYFITQVGLAASSFGVSPDDVAAVAAALNTLFNRACSPPATVIKAQGAHLQAICIDQASCVKAVDAVCEQYAAGTSGTSTTVGANTTMTASTGTDTGTPPNATPPSTGASGVPAPSSGAARAEGGRFAATAVGIALAAVLL